MGKLEDGLALFEQGEYDLAIQNLIDAYHSQNQNQQIIQFIYDCFITPNEEEFAENYSQVSFLNPRISYQNLVLDFIPVSDLKYYIYHKINRDFYGVIDVSGIKKYNSEDSKLYVLLTDICDFRVILNLFESNPIEKGYLVLSEEINLFSSFYKLKEIRELTEQKLVIFESRKALIDFFLKENERCLPGVFVGENIIQEQKIINILQSIRNLPFCVSEDCESKITVLQLLTILINDLAGETDVLNKKSFVQTYHMITKEEKSLFFDEMESSLHQNKELYMYVLSYLLHIADDNLVIEEINQALLSYDYSIEQYLSINFKLTNSIFINTKLGNEEVYKSRLRVREKYLNRICEKMDVDLSYIPYGHRNQKRVLFLIEPMLGEQHAPSLRAINLYMVLERLGYEPGIISSSLRDVHLHNISLAYYPIYMNSLTRATQTIEHNFMGEKIEVMHYYYHNQSFCNELESAVEWIRNYNPEFIIEVGGNNTLADICSNFTTVLSRTCAATLPITMSKYILDFFDDKDILGNKVLETQRLVHIPNVTFFKPIQDKVSREQYGIAQNDFVVAIAGNRLDREVKTDFLEMLKRVLAINHSIKCLFIGKCDIVEEKLQYNSQTIFCGFVNSFENTIGICDLFLNPPRQGGGTGAMIAIEKNVPVVTLPDCDVASYVGDEFICRDLPEMERVIGQYIQDEDFYQKQKKKCALIQKKKGQTLEKVMTQMNDFCDNIKVIIQSDEKGMQSYDTI